MTDQLARTVVATLGILAALTATDTTVWMLLAAIGAWPATDTTALSGCTLLVVSAVCAGMWLHLGRALDGGP